MVEPAPAPENRSSDSAPVATERRLLSDPAFVAHLNEAVNDTADRFELDEL